MEWHLMMHPSLPSGGVMQAYEVMEMQGVLLPLVPVEE